MAGRHEKVVRVSSDSVKVALPVVGRQIETGIYAARLHQATEAERRYLFAILDLMAAEGVGQVRSGDVARELNRELSAVSPRRDNLIRKGVIHSPEPGALAFSIPGFREYVEGRRGAAFGISGHRLLGQGGACGPRNRPRRRWTCPSWRGAPGRARSRRGAARRRNRHGEADMTLLKWNCQLNSIASDFA